MPHQCPRIQPWRLAVPPIGIFGLRRQSQIDQAIFPIADPDSDSLLMMRQIVRPIQHKFWRIGMGLV
jgi:hypothetical protein